MAFIVVTLLALIALYILKTLSARFTANTLPPISVNYHFTRECNFRCGFCFHTAKTSYILPIEDAKRGILLLKNAGTKKLNFAGGEPFLYQEYLGKLLDYAKEVGMESVSIVSNGSLVTRQYLKKHADSIDVLAISCDSFDAQTNLRIGRLSGTPFKRLEMIALWCNELNIKFKVNTVVNAFNKNEDMNAKMHILAPFRWKCFQVLMDASENSGVGDTTRDVRPFMISSAEFDTFIAKHDRQKCIVPEPNNLMRSSYLILDEYMRFLNKEGTYGISPSILEVGVRKALDQTIWQRDSFIQRGGVYDWTKKNQSW